MKKTLFKRLLFVFLVASLLLTACSQATQQAAAPASNAPVTLRFVNWNSQLKDSNEALAKAYTEKHPNVTVKFDYIGDQNSTAYLQKVDLMVLGNEEMDIIMAPTAATMLSRAASGTYLPLDDLLSKEGVKADDVYTMIARQDGKVYAIPSDKSYSFVIINKDMLDKAGLPVPSLDWTWNDYREYAKKLTSGDGVTKVYGSHFHSWSSYNYLAMTSVKQDNALFKTPTETTFQDPNFAAFLQLRYDMENVDKSQTPIKDVKSLKMAYRDRFFNGLAAMFPTYSYMIPEVVKQDKFPHTFKTTFAPWPKFGNDGVARRSQSNASYYAISKTSKHPQEAYAFLRWYTTEGVAQAGQLLSAAKGIDMKAALTKIVGPNADKYVDMDALLKVMTSMTDNPDTFAPTYQSAVDDLVGQESDKFLFGGQSIYATIKNLTDGGNKIIADSGK